MCTTCGCGGGETRIDGVPVADHEHVHTHADGTTHAHPHEHVGDHAHDHAGARWHRHADGAWHSHDHGQVAAAPLGAAHAPGIAAERIVQIERDILAKNDAFARENRALFADRGVFALNLVSSPGSGKTTLLVRTIEALRGRLATAVIEGDQQTSRDADRVRATGAPAIQINTGKGCHLDAHMVGQALRQLPLADGSLLLIENVGNLVCPAAFDLGEAHKVVILSVTEGEDKPIKYPDLFHAADLLLVNKVDLLPHLDFDVEAAVAFAHRVRPGLEVIRVSATTGEGFEAWLAWLDRGVAAARAARDANLDALRRRVAELEARLAAGA
ncbi:MAG: hydrogenase nickel incorporation protein HypB [Betaproteobacteria bacterium]|nr:hydrogenase nickel incorporation protein HypB [Betaproteobacteria bacterium]MBK9675983.1 hydrogenase nickel incorporation protein HypB [Betaproteobacteria bacterium]